MTISKLAQLLQGLVQNVDLTSEELHIGSLKLDDGTEATLSRSELASLKSNEHASGSDNQNVVAGDGLSGGGSGATVNLAVTADVLRDADKGVANGVASLGAGGKIPTSQLPNSVMEYQGSFDPASATFTDAGGNAGDVWLATAAGSYDAGSGSITYAIGDWAVHNGSVFEKSLNSDAVVSVNSQTGVVTLDADDIDDAATTHKFASAAQLEKVDYLTVTQAVDLDALETASHAAMTLHAGDATQQSANLSGQELELVQATDSTDGVMSAEDKAKLDGIEASADVTDAVNVDAAGAVMDADFASDGILVRSGGAGSYSVITDNSSNWDTAYTDRLKWDGGATDLVPATGRSSLELGDSATKDVGTGAGDVAAGDHDHDGTYSPVGHSHTASDVTDFDSAAKTAAVVNSTAGSETDQAASVAAMKTYVGNQIGSADDIVRTMVAGESFAQDVAFAVRMAVNGETVGRVYKCDITAASGAEAHVIGIVNPSAAKSAGDDIDVYMLGEIDSSVDFTASQDEGKPVFIDASGNPTVTAPSTSGHAVSQLGTVSAVGASTSKVMVQSPRLVYVA